MSEYPNSAQPLQPVSPDPDLLELLFREIAAAGNQLKITTALLNRADRLPPGGLSVLQMLGRASQQTVPQIARYRMTSRQNIQVTINRLAVQGCVESLSNPAHKRSGLYQLTAKGRVLLSEAEHRAVRLRDALEAELGRRSIQHTTEFLARMREALAAFGKGAGQKSLPTIATTARKRPAGGARKAPGEETKAPVGAEDPAFSIPKPPPESELPLSLL